MKKKAFILSVFAVFVLCFLAIAFVWYKSDFKTLAQSDTTGNTNCLNKNGERKNLDSGNKAQENDRCDFSRYKTLKVRSLKINSLPQAFAEVARQSEISYHRKFNPLNLAQARGKC